MTDRTKLHRVKFDSLASDPVDPVIGDHWYNSTDDAMRKHLAGPAGTGVTRTYACLEDLPFPIPAPLVAYNGYEHGFAQDNGGFATDGSTATTYRGTPTFTATWRCANDDWTQFNPEIWMDWDNPKGGGNRSDASGNTKLRLHSFRHPSHQNGINHSGFKWFGGDTAFPIDSEWGPVGTTPYENAITFTPNLLNRYRLGQTGTPPVPGDFPIESLHYQDGNRQDLRIGGYSTGQNKLGYQVKFYFAIDNPAYDFTALPSSPQNQGICHKILGPYSCPWVIVPIVEYDALGGRYYTGIKAVRR